MMELCPQESKHAALPKGTCARRPCIRGEGAPACCRSAGLLSCPPKAVDGGDGGLHPVEPAPTSHHSAAPADAIGYAERDNIDWILHIDTDELLYPGGSNGFSLQRILGNYAQDVDTVVFPNYEAMPESEGVQDPFTEVSGPAPLSQHAGLAAQAGHRLVPWLITFWVPKDLLCCSSKEYLLCACMVGPLHAAQAGFCWQCWMRWRCVQGQLCRSGFSPNFACCPSGY